MVIGPLVCLKWLLTNRPVLCSARSTRVAVWGSHTKQTYSSCSRRNDLYARSLVFVLHIPIFLHSIASCLEAFLLTMLTWVFHRRSQVIVIPRCLHSVIDWSLMKLILYSKGIGERLLVMWSTWHFCTLNFICQVAFWSVNLVEKFWNPRASR